MTFDLGTGASAAFSRNRYDTAPATSRNAQDFKMHYSSAAYINKLRPTENSYPTTNVLLFSP